MQVRLYHHISIVSILGRISKCVLRSWIFYLHHHMVRLLYLVVAPYLYFYKSWISIVHFWMFTEFTEFKGDLVGFQFNFNFNFCLSRLNNFRKKFPNIFNTIKCKFSIIVKVKMMT